MPTFDSLPTPDSQNISGYIHSGIIWSDTDEGSIYWENVFGMLMYGGTAKATVLPTQLSKKISDYIDMSFTWQLTDERHDYWYDVATILEIGKRHETDTKTT